MASGCEVGHGDASAVPLSEAVEKAVASRNTGNRFCLDGPFTTFQPSPNSKFLIKSYAHCTSMHL